MDAATKSKSTNVHSSFRYDLMAFLGHDYVQPAGPADAVAGVEPKVIVSPANEMQLAEVLRRSDEAGIAVIPRGGGTKLGWGNPPSRAELILSTARLSEITEHAWADLTVSVDAGCTIQKLQQTLALHGQRLALDPLWPNKATIGGVLSSNDSGALRLRFGGLRDLIIGITLALPDGTLASSGGRVVKNVAGYDLPSASSPARFSACTRCRAAHVRFPSPQLPTRKCADSFTPFRIRNSRTPRCKHDSKMALPPPSISCSKEPRPDSRHKKRI
jgi:hypothetical protein